MTKVIWTNDFDLIKQIKFHESKGGIPELKPYTDTEGWLTIGHGRNLEGKGITEVEAQMLLLNDIADITRELDVLLPWWRTLKPEAQRVLIDMSMMGTKKVLKFTKMLAALKEGNYELAASELINSKYAKQTKTRAVDLHKQMRR